MICLCMRLGYLGGGDSQDNFDSLRRKGFGDSMNFDALDAPRTGRQILKHISEERGESLGLRTFNPLVEKTLSQKFYKEIPEPTSHIS